MRVEVVTVGTELLLGQIVNTNATVITERLATAGISCHYCQVVGDNQDRIVLSIRTALARSDAVIVCGGLGPTPDDITREAVAEVMNTRLHRNDEIARYIEGLFQSKGMVMPPNNLRQADVPAGASVIPQSNGTAPGLVCPMGQKVMYVLPGVPREMEEMLSRAAIPDLEKRMSEAGETRVMESRTLRTWGLAESALAQRLEPLIDSLDRDPSGRHLPADTYARSSTSSSGEQGDPSAGQLPGGQLSGSPALLETRLQGKRSPGKRSPTVRPLEAQPQGTQSPEAHPRATIAFLASGIEGIKVRITATATKRDDAQGLLARVENEVRNTVGPAVFGVDDETMEIATASLLESRGLTIALAESLTGGLATSRLVAVPGASRWLKGGIVSYASSAKYELLGVAPGPVISKEAAISMAVHVADLLHADIGLSFTGVAGPDRQEDQPPGRVYLGIAMPKAGLPIPAKGQAHPPGPYQRPSDLRDSPDPSHLPEQGPEQGPPSQESGESPEDSKEAKLRTSGRVTEAVELNLPGDRNLVRQLAVISGIDLVRRRLLRRGEPLLTRT
ncbi:MAG: nicotinamide-nucleotide amidohydrolase family protein [Acidimicrobiales bacterium]